MGYMACKVKGIGSVTLKYENGYNYNFERVRSQDYRNVSNLNRNLILMGNLDDIGLQGKIEDEILKMIKWFLLIFKSTKTNRVYVNKDAIYDKTNTVTDTTLKYHKTIKFFTNRDNSEKILS